MRTADKVTEPTAVKSDILITNDEMLAALSAFSGKPIQAFTDEPTQNGWWLKVKRGNDD